MRRYTVVVNDCAAPSERGLIHVRTRTTDIAGQNFTFSYDHAVEGLPAPLTPRQQDWIETLGRLFACDLACDRGPEAEWNRRLDVHLPVRDPDLWNALAPQLADVFAELTYDDLVLHFHADTDPPDPPRPRKRPYEQFDAVALFSGGTDSFVGTAQMLADGKTPALLTHASGSAIRTAVGHLRGELRKLGDLGPALTITAQRRGGEGGENSQRSRSLLFLGVGALVASTLGLDEVFINENGVMAVHAPMTAARLGSLSTRTASPSLLDAFSALATNALGTPISARNLLQQDTKPEVVGRGVGLGVGTALANTISCWSIARNRRHCGYCAPCLIRRISFETHGTMDAIYDTNPLDGDRATDAVVHDNLVQLLMLARDLTEMPPALIELEYTELLNTGAAMTLAQSVDMHARWGTQALAVAHNHPYAAGLA